MNDSIDIPCGTVELLTGGHPLSKTYTESSKCFVFSPDTRRARTKIAIDAEDLTTQAPFLLNSRSQTSEGFLRDWTSTECLAKLFDIPILAWIKRMGLYHSSSDVFNEFQYQDAKVSLYTMLWKKHNVVISCAFLAPSALY